MTTRAPIRFGTIGFGIMGERLLRAALAHDRTALSIAGVWDPSPDAMERLARTLPEVARFATLEDLLAASDAVHIASPPVHHLQQLEACADAGVAALCEKPLAVDVASARATLDRVAAKNGRAAVNFPFASSFAVDQIDAWRSSGAIGAPRRLSIVAAFAAWPRPWQMAAASWLSKRLDGGFTREVLSHFIFLTIRQFGVPKLIEAKVTYPPGDGAETAISATLEAAGVPIALSGRVGGTEQADHNLWVLEGEKCKFRLRDWAIAERLQDDGRWQSPLDAKSNEEMRPLVLSRQLDKVIAMTRGEPHALATLEEALAVQSIVEAMLTC